MRKGRVLYRETESYVSHYKRSKHQCTRLGSKFFRLIRLPLSQLLKVCGNVSQKWRDWRCRRLTFFWRTWINTELRWLSGWSRPAFKDCRDLYARVCLWLVRAWVIQIPFAAILADIHRGRFKLMTSRLLFSKIRNIHTRGLINDFNIIIFYHAYLPYNYELWLPNYMILEIQYDISKIGLPS